MQSGERRRGLPYREGDWFAVPLRDGDWAVGIVARKRPRARTVLGYFFGPRRQALPNVDELAHLTAEDAIWVSRFTTHGMIRGTWPVLGPAPGWDRSRWPMPAFCFCYSITGDCVRREYPDDDPGALFVRQSRSAPEECARLPRDGTSFVGAVEISLTKLLPKGASPA